MAGELTGVVAHRSTLTQLNMSSGGSSDPPLPPDKLNELRYDDLESEARLAV